MRQLKYLVASTTDGYIARQDGSIDFFPSQGDHLAGLFTLFPETVPAHLRKTYGVTGENQCFDAVLMGRKTYQLGLDIGVTNPYPTMKQYLFSRTLVASPDANVELVSERPRARVRRLKQEPGKDIWLCGGAILASALLSEIDELILKVNPILLAEPGLPLFAGPGKPVGLQLKDSKLFSNGFMLNRYRLQG